VFGWKRPDGSRRFRKVWEEVPKKNGKTETAAATGVHLLTGDNEPGAEVYTTATAKEQAEICHTAAREMVIQSPELNQFVRVPKKKGGNLVCDALGSKMQILSSDFGTQDGLSPHGDIRDEVHAWKDHELDGVLSTAMGARSQPLTLEVTTAGVYDKDGVGWQHHDYAVSVLEQQITDDRQFVFIAAMDEGDDPFDPITWWKANPNLGVSLYPDFIAEQANEAKRNPRKFTAFLQYHLNVWTAVVSRWFNMECWRACPSKPLDVDALGAVALLRRPRPLAHDGPHRLRERLHPAERRDRDLLPRFWLPQEKLDEEFQKGPEQIQNLGRCRPDHGDPGATVDYEFIEKQIKEDNDASSIARSVTTHTTPTEPSPRSTPRAADGRSSSGAAVSLGRVQVPRGPGAQQTRAPRRQPGDGLERRQRGREDRTRTATSRPTSNARRTRSTASLLP
jgi:hypothetical protein